MARTVTVQFGQCLEDIALQEYGSIDGVTPLVMNNEDVLVSGFSTDLVPGTVLRVVGDPIDPDMVAVMRAKGIVPATADAEGVDAPEEEGGDFDDSFNDDFNT